MTSEGSDGLASRGLGLGTSNGTFYEQVPLKASRFSWARFFIFTVAVIVIFLDSANKEHRSHMSLFINTTRENLPPN